ncbi:MULTISPECIES: TVP38/TMEM64 family protein [Halomonas]|uniref:TVP38/TMEM64 family membrane protein n=2 Tax=Halomonas TaxID=2745 RepID=A0ABQ0U0H8_9GAMM|nr:MULTISPECIES: TVP38/TMEM64 family protein [Halomonas]PSJ22460.1 TVP38/TMEM64 family protein [Halomonas sp. ND22Bw]KGE78811.1 phospholipase [Halomonas salina]MDR5888701.1 TVP38/TMEM64 family protein [Halomonas salina]RAH37657.1 TVP38/TMEM64 family protein [Halomonas sp. SL1]WJY07881.1 TVP38/TMEM64 family protein [Halomonas halophila]
MSRSLGVVALTLTLLVVLGLLWQWLAMQDLLTVDSLMALAKGSVAWRDAPWAVLVVMAVYAGASLVMFPLSLLVALTGLLFGPWWGFGYALAGTLAASVLTWWVGRKLGRDALLRHGGQRLKGLSRYLSGRGIRTMTLVNLLPLAPFTLTNMMAGAFHLRFRDYMIGSTLGILPGLAGVTLLGSQLGELAAADSRKDVVMALGGLVLGVALLYGLKRWAERRRRR